MDTVSRPRVKICCIANVEEAWLAIRHGASAVGLVSAMPSGPGPIPENLIARIAKIVPPGVTSFLLTSKQNASEMILQHHRCGTSAIQLCDRLENGDYARLREASPGIGLVQVVHVTGEESLHEACTITPHVSAVLLDSGKPSLAIRELGGTGRTHNWSISKRIREKVEVPVFLAGGLTATNAAEGVRQVKPFGVDVCNGVRTEGKLDEEKLSAFFAAVSSCNQ